MDWYPIYPIIFRSSRPEVFLGKSVLKICRKFTGEHPYRSAISIKLQSNFNEITLRHGCSTVNLLHISEHLFLGTTLDGCFCVFFQRLSNESPAWIKLLPWATRDKRTVKETDIIIKSSRNCSNSKNVNIMIN